MLQLPLIVGPMRITSKPTGVYRSKFEAKVAEQIASLGHPVEYEKESYIYHEEHKYTSDFRLPNGIIVECKGYFDSSDRSKMLKVKKEHPEVDIRLLFQRSSNFISKNSLTTYGEWATQHGFKWAEGTIPMDWFKE